MQEMQVGFSLWVGNIPWRREWQPTPVFLPGESHGQRSLAGYSPWACETHDLATKQQQCLLILTFPFLEGAEGPPTYLLLSHLELSLLF